MDSEVKMTTPLSLFLDTNARYDLVENAIVGILGHPLSRVELDVGVVHKTSALCIEWLLFRNHGLEDDCGIKFSEYEYQLQLVPIQQGQELPEFDAMYAGCAVFVASRLARSLKCRTLVIANLQREVAAYAADTHVAR